MNRAVFFLTVAALFLCGLSALAADKVVVVPMGSSAKGTNGQVQYNDDGKTAGAELYYDKSSYRLEARGEVRTTDGSGNPRLWGRGRPGTTLYSHAEVCPSLIAPTRYALSTQFVTWEAAAEACPVGKWVCTGEELPALGHCNVTPSFSEVNYKDCDQLTHNTYDYREGWVADAYVPDAPAATYVSDEGVTVPTNNFSPSYRSHQHSCYKYRVWCCWKNTVTLPPLP